MVKYHLHQNGWTVILDDFKFSKATQQDINDIAKLLSTNTLVVAHNQDDVTVEDELRVAHMFGNPGVLNDPNSDLGKMTNVDPDGFVCRVSGETDEQGDNTGIAGYSDEMTWHSNEPFSPERRPLVWLRGIKGTKGSVTTYNNNILTYNDLSQETKDLLQDKQMILKGEFSLQNPTNDIITYVEGGNIKEGYTPNVVHTNIAGITGLYFPWIYIHSFAGITVEETRKITEPLARFTVQEKYLYHHEWNDNDIVIAEQWLGIHKRKPFSEIANRVLHRVVFNFPTQDYSK